MAVGIDESKVKLSGGGGNRSAGAVTPYQVKDGGLVDVLGMTAQDALRAYDTASKEHLRRLQNINQIELENQVLDAKIAFDTYNNSELYTNGLAKAQGLEATTAANAYRERSAKRLDEMLSGMSIEVRRAVEPSLRQKMMGIQQGLDGRALEQRYKFDKEAQEAKLLSLSHNQATKASGMLDEALLNRENAIASAKTEYDNSLRALSERRQALSKDDVSGNEALDKEEATLKQHYDGKIASANVSYDEVVFEAGRAFAANRESTMGILQQGLLREMGLTLEELNDESRADEQSIKDAKILLHYKMAAFRTQQGESYVETLLGNGKLTEVEQILNNKELSQMFGIDESVTHQTLSSKLSLAKARVKKDADDSIDVAKFQATEMNKVDEYGNYVISTDKSNEIVATYVAAGNYKAAAIINEELVKRNKATEGNRSLYDGGLLDKPLTQKERNVMYCVLQNTPSAFVTIQDSAGETHTVSKLALAKYLASSDKSMTKEQREDFLSGFSKQRESTNILHELMATGSAAPLGWQFEDEELVYSVGDDKTTGTWFTRSKSGSLALNDDVVDNNLRYWVGDGALQGLPDKSVEQVSGQIPAISSLRARSSDLYRGRKVDGEWRQLTNVQFNLAMSEIDNTLDAWITAHPEATRDEMVKMGAQLIALTFTGEIDENNIGGFGVRDMSNNTLEHRLTTTRDLQSYFMEKTNASTARLLTSDLRSTTVNGKPIFKKNKQDNVTKQ